MILRLPGLTDVHVHMREPGGTHKEDWDTGTAAALAGGVTTVLAMPNTQPPVTDDATLHLTRDLAEKKARCDYGIFMGAGTENVDALAGPAPQCAGLKMYLDQTFGPLRVDEMPDWMAHFRNWPRDYPIAVHAEGKTLAAAILMAALFNRPVHLCHVSRREEILVIRKAKEKGVPVTCEVTPHHLFLTDEDIPAMGEQRAEVRPRLASPRDRDALWDNLDIVDIIATDHAPHTLGEKEGPNPPPGFPGIETALPLLLTAVREKRLEMEDLIALMVENPRRIFRLPTQPDTWIEIDPDEKWDIRAENMKSRCGWTPFEGRQVRGKLRRVVLRGMDAYVDGEVKAPRGFGKNIRG